MSPQEAENSTSPAILELQDVSVRYHDGTEALRGVSLSVPPGQRLALLGPNGAGKTSLLLAVMGAVPWQGRIVIDGLELSRRNLPQARGRCGMIFQDADDQLFMPTLLEDVSFGPLNQGCTGDSAAERARQAVDAVGLTGLEGRPAHHLSGGQKRCAALATVLAMRVGILLLDEPGSNLDFRSRRQIIRLLADRTESQLLATHDLDMVRRLCDRVVVLDQGRLVADGSATEILTDASLLREHGLSD